MLALVESRGKDGGLLPAERTESGYRAYDKVCGSAWSSFRQASESLS
ncbi:hypothetical protein ACIA2T_15675 [Amycolatopsis japonica]